MKRVRKKGYELLEERLEMDTSNINTDRAHFVVEKSSDKQRVVVLQFSFYKNKINIPRNCKKLKGTKMSYSKIYPKRQCKFVQKNERNY